MCQVDVYSSEYSKAGPFKEVPLVKTAEIYVEQHRNMFQMK